VEPELFSDELPDFSLELPDFSLEPAGLSLELLESELVTDGLDELVLFAASRLSLR
jgi:hypothetical protein